MIHIIYELSVLNRMHSLEWLKVIQYHSIAVADSCVTFGTEERHHHMLFMVAGGESIAKTNFHVCKFEIWRTIVISMYILLDMDNALVTKRVPSIRLVLH